MNSDPNISDDLLKRQLRDAISALRGTYGTANADNPAREKAIREDLPKEWYTVPEAAAILEEHPKTVYERVREGQIGSSRPSPRKTKIHREDLITYLRKHKP